MHNLQHEFTNRKISPWGGIKFFQGTYSRMEIRKKLEELALPAPGSNRGYNPIDLIEGFMCSVVLGSKRLSHTSMLRTDKVIQEIFGWKKGLGDQSTYSRFFQKFDINLNDSVFPQLMRNCFEKINVDRMTIDVDSTVITRYGEQEEARVGYNPTKRGRASHHPIMAFCDELAMVVNGWMRSGDSVSLSDAVSFLKETLTIVPAERIGLMRFDSGFFSNDIMSFLEEQPSPVNYIIRGKMMAGIKSAIQSQKTWSSCDDIFKGAQYCLTQYKATGWMKARTMAIVRTKKQNNVKEEQGKIFEDEIEFDSYEYKVFFTNVNFSAVKIHGLYNQRANSENRIKELKYDYGIEGFSLKSFPAMEAAFRFVLLAYNIMAAFKIWVMETNKGKMLSTIKFQCIAIGSYLVQTGRQKKLKLSAEGKQRHFLEYYFNNLEKLHPPFSIPNA